MQLSEILPDRDYTHQMRFVKNSFDDFYRPGPYYDEIVAERRHWLAEASQLSYALLDEGRPLLDEFQSMALAHSFLPSDLIDQQQRSDPSQSCRLIGENLEADFLLMLPDRNGTFRLVGGCLCFPSHWNLADKMGHPMTTIHGPVPGLNEALGKQIDGFLQRMKAGISWERFNWGLSRSSERNLHPSRDIPRLDASVELNEVWWRLEEQSLVALPESGGVLFGIKIVIKPLAEIRADPTARDRLARAIRTMPQSMASYKGIADARQRLLELLN